MTLSNTPRDDVSDASWRAVPSADGAPEPAHDAGPQPVTLEPISDNSGPPPAGAVRPNAHFMHSHIAHLIAFGFGSGLSFIAPGTAGTLWAWLVWSLLSIWLPPAVMGGLLLASLPLAWWASTVTASHLRRPDPSAIVIDEIVAFWAVLWLLLPAGFWTQMWAFVLFRFFDAVKPGPVGWADRVLHGKPGWRGGLGIVLDDLVAAFCTLLTIALWRMW